jgi:hypothetical protein
VSGWEKIRCQVDFPHLAASNVGISQAPKGRRTIATGASPWIAFAPVPQPQGGERTSASPQPQSPSLTPNCAFPICALLAPHLLIGKAQRCADCLLGIGLCASCCPESAPFARTIAHEPKFLNRFKSRAMHSKPLSFRTLPPAGSFFTARPPKAEIGQKRVKRGELRPTRFRSPFPNCEFPTKDFP